MPNIQYYVACEAVQGKIDYYYSLFHRTDISTSVPFLSVAQVGPIQFAGKDYYGLVISGVTDSTTSSNNWSVYLDYTSLLGGYSGEPGGIFPYTFTEFSTLKNPYYRWNDATGAEPTQRILGGSQSEHVYVAELIDEFGGASNSLSSYEYYGLVSPPTFNWAKKIYIGSNDFFDNQVYFDNWQTYVFWGLSGNTTFDGNQHIYLRKYNQSGTLIWHRRLSYSSSATFFVQGQMAGYDSGNVSYPIAFQDSSASEPQVWVIRYLAGGTVDSTFPWKIWTGSAESGGISTPAHVVSSRPSWDRQYVAWGWRPFDGGGTSLSYIAALAFNYGSAKILSTSNYEMMPYPRAIEVPSDGSAIFPFYELDDELYTASIVLVRVDHLGEIIWQRRISFRYEHESVETDLQITSFSVKWASEDSFFIVATLFDADGFWGTTAEEIFVSLAFPFDGSLESTHELSFGNFNGGSVQTESLIVDYAESSIVFAGPTSETPDNPTVFTADSTDDFTTVNLSTPSKTDVPFNHEMGFIK